MELDLNENRKKKLEAGKEKLAAFRKKKAKKKKTESEKQEASKDIIEPLNGGEIRPSNPCWNDVLSAQEDSDQFFISSGDEFSSEEPETRSSVYYQTKLANAKQRISELEETVEGKQLALDSMMREYNQHKTQNDPYMLSENVNEQEFTSLRSTDMERALAQRDALIAQLTESLQTSSTAPLGQADMLSQIQALSQEVTVLQNQLHETDQAMKEQSALHEFSSSAVQAAKNQMLQLQTIVIDKDRHLQSLCQQLESSQDALQRVHDEKEDVAKDLLEKTQELSTLSQNLEDLRHLEEIQSQWREQEKSLQDELASKHEEIKELLETEEKSKTIVAELRDSSKEKDGKFQTLKEELEEFKRIKLKMENEYCDLIKANEELASEQQNISSSLSDHHILTAEFDKLTQAHSELSSEYNALKSKCLLLENVVDELKQENTSSKSHLSDLKERLEGERQRHLEEEKSWRDLESKQNAYSDQLNNKVNDLQNRFSTSEEALLLVEKNLELEKQQMVNLNSQLTDQQAQNLQLLSAIKAKNGEIAEFEKLQQESQNVIEKLRDKEKDLEKTVEGLFGRSTELENKLGEVKLENEMLTEQTVQLKDELSTVQYVHSVEMSENEYRENIDEQMELLNKQLSSAMRRSAELEDKVKEKENDLMIESEQRKLLEDQLIGLESERDTLRETVQSLNTDIGQLKEELVTETKSPVEEKIMAYQNLQLSASLKKSGNEAEEKVQLKILEEEILSLKGHLEEKESVTCNLKDELHRCQSQHQEELENLKSEVQRLEKDLESHCSNNQMLSEEILELKHTLEKTQGHLTDLKASHLFAEGKLEKMHDEKVEMEGKLKDAGDTVKELEREKEDLKLACKMSQNREEELLTNYKDMEGQLHTAVSDWQKLQELVEEKESQIQSLHQDLEEERSKQSAMEKCYEDQITLINSDTEEWKGKCSEAENNLTNLQAQLSQGKADFEMKEKELQEVAHVLSEKDSAIRDLELKLVEIKTDMGGMFEENVKDKKEVSELHSKLETSQENCQRAQAEIEEVKAILDTEKRERESLLERLDSEEKELFSKARVRDELEHRVNDLQMQLEKKTTDVDDFTRKLEELNGVVADLESRCRESDDLLGKRELEHSLLSESLNKAKLQGQRVAGVMAILNEDLQAKENVMLAMSLTLEEKKDMIDHLNECIKEKEQGLKELEESRATLLSEKTKLEIDNQRLMDENQGINIQIKKLADEAVIREQDAVQLSVASKQLQEEVNQARLELEVKNSTIHDLTHDNEIQKKEMLDLKSDIEEKEIKTESLVCELDALQTELQTSNEEKRLLKTNFDACMEDVQQKTADQEAELRHLKCHLAEESRNISQGQKEMKEIYEQQLSQLEDKLLLAEKEKSNLEKELSEALEKACTLKESYENQLSELEMNLQAANSECVRLNENMSKSNVNFESEIADLKSLHEMQRSELLDNNISLEKAKDELQKIFNEKMETSRRERAELEQSFEVQMLEMDEKRRFSESEVARLKRHLDEMKKDNENEVQDLEKRYDTQLFELEDKCSIMGAELERARKSMMSVEGDFVEERKILELKVEDLENIRRELEIKISVLDDDLSNLKAQSLRREEEMKSILKNAAGKQTDMENEIGCLTKDLAYLKSEKIASIESLKKEFENSIEDLETRNKHLEAKVSVLEMNAEEDMVLRSENKKEGELETAQNSQIALLKEQVGVLSNENLSLKRRLLSRKSSEKKSLFSTGVEDICPSYPTEAETASHLLPKLMTSTPSKGFDSEDSFSPTVEEVSMIEGFVAERDQPVYSSLSMQSYDEERVGEPDFVAEEPDRFQPEMVIEKVLESAEHPTLQLHIHPIREEAITEGFQPEVGDQFFMETEEEPNGIWPSDLSVGVSPTLQEKQQFHFSNIPAPENDVDRTLNPENRQAPLIGDSNQNANWSLEVNPGHQQESEELTIKFSEMNRKLDDLRDKLEEEYVTKMRNQKRDLVVEYESKRENYQREMELHVNQRAQSIKNDYERKFAKALQKVRRDVERRHLKELRQARQGQMAKTSSGDIQEEQRNNSSTDDGMPDIAEGSEELDEKVQQLSKENQELAEARDELLKEIEISQTWGRHHRVQHELQSKISGRESPVSQLPYPQTLTSEISRSEESPVVSPSNTLTSTSPVHLEAAIVPATQCVSSCVQAREESGGDSKAMDVLPSDNVSSEAGSCHTEMSETSSARERFLEEFTDISQQSSQDLPLEWELTTTIDDAGGFERDPQHGSVWEVFDGRCMRQDCQEVRQSYGRLLRYIVKSSVDGEDLLSEESGLLIPSIADILDDNSDGLVPGELSDVPNCIQEEVLFLSDFLKLERERLDEEISVENLKRIVFETQQENETLRTRIADERRVRHQLENATKAMSINATEEKEALDLLTIAKESVDKYTQVDLADHATSDHNLESMSSTVVLEKEHCLMKLEAELANLKSLQSHASDIELGKAEMLREEIDSLKKEVQFKDKVIKNLREDLNRLIYPKMPVPDNTDSGSLERLSCQKSVSVESNPQVIVSNSDPSSHPIESRSCVSSGLSDFHHESSRPISSMIPGETDREMELSNCANEEEMGKAIKFDTVCHPTSPGGLDVELAAGEGLALISQQDFEIAARQFEQLTTGQDEGSLDEQHQETIETEEVDLIDGSFASSSSSSTLPSSLNTPELSNGRDTPPVSELQDKTLAKELNQIRKDLRETRAMYSKENSLFQEALRRDQMAKDVVDSWKRGEETTCGGPEVGESQQENDEMLMEDELNILRQRLTICLEQNKMLEAENTSLRARIREQDAVVLIVKQKLMEKERTSDEWRKSMNHQLLSIQEQRDNLLNMLRNVEDGKIPSISEAIGQATMKEENLRKIQEDLMEKMEELDHLHQMLTQRQIELQHCEAERRHLEQLCLLKDQTEMQLMKQKRLMEEQVTEIELRLRERETTLVDEKTRLLRELREKDKHLSQMSQSARSSPTPLLTTLIARSSSVGDLNSGLLETLNTTKRHKMAQSQSPSSVPSIDDADKQHMEAINKLKEKLKLEYDLRAARMAESQASAIASYWYRHGKSS